MNRFFVALAALAMLAGTAAAQCSISSAFTSNNGLAGNMFDVRNIGPNTIRISSLAINIDAGTATVQVWAVTGGGTATGVQQNQAAWTLMGEFPGLVTNGPNVPTPLPAFCSALDIPSGGVQGLFVVSTSGPSLNYTTGSVVGTVLADDGTMQILEGYGTSSFTATPINGRQASVVVNYVCPGPPGPPPTPQFQLNRPGATLRINNADGSACAPTIVTDTIYACNPVTPVTGTVLFSSTNVGFAWDIVISPLALVAGNAGGITLADGQIINLDFSAVPFFMNNVLSSPLPGLGIPGVTETTMTFNFSLSAAVSFSAQAITLNPASPTGVDLSRAAQYQATVVPPLTSVSGPTTDTSSVAVNVTAPSTCWAPNGIPFFGTNYTQLFVTSNGRVVFNATDTDGSATVAEGLTDNPFVGFWTDLNPALGGSITITNPASGIVRVNYNGVPYAGEAATANTFAIEFDVTTGTVTLDGLTGIVANPQSTTSVNDSQFLGITRGNTGATNLGSSTLFTNGGSGLASDPTHMWYDFYANTTGGGRASSLVAGTLNRIVFVPSGGFAPNYDWIGQ